MATAGPPCARCGWMLRWFQPQFAWVCDRCRAVYPSGPAPAPGAMPVARARKPLKLPSRRVLIAIGAAAVAVATAVVVWFLLSGRSDGGPAHSRDELVERTVAAFAAHDADALIRLSDFDGLRDKMLDCEDTAEAREGHDRNLKEMKESFTKEVERTSKIDIELGKVTKPKRYDDVGDTDDKPTKLSVGDSAGEGCKFKVEAAFHTVEFTIKVSSGGRTKEQDASIMALEVEGEWHLISPPRIWGEIGGNDCRAALDNALKLSRQEMLKMPNVTESDLESLSYDLRYLCDSDAWAEDVRRCLADAQVSGDVEVCMRKLSSAQMTSVTEKIMRMSEY